MSLKRVSQLPAFNGVPASGVGGTATLDLPVGPRYKAITLVVKDSNNANASVIIGDMRLMVNGKQQRIFSVAQLDRLNSRCGPAAYQLFDQDATWNTAPARSIVTTGLATYNLFKDSSNYTRITIFFSESWRPSGVGAALAWATGGLASFQLEVDITTSAGTVTMTAFAEVDKALVSVRGLDRQADMPMGNIVKWIRTTVPVTGTTVNWQNFPRKSGVLQAVHFSDQYVTNVQVKADNYEWRNLSQNDNLYLLAQQGMVGSASWYDVELDYDDVPEGAGLILDGIQDLQFNLTLSDGTARNITTICEILGPPE